jgi:hypothetical protein
MSDQFSESLRKELFAALFRHRGTLHFPLNPMEVYRACLPDQIVDWCVIPMAQRDCHFQRRNLMGVVPMSNTVKFAFGEGKDVDLLLDVGETPPTFYLTLPVEVVTNVDDAFLMPDDLRRNPYLITWYNRACKLENELEQFRQDIYTMTHFIRRPVMFAALYPELIPAVPKTMAGRRYASASTAAKSKEVRTARELIAQEGINMNRLRELIAAATLLPDHEPDAWVVPV